MARTFSVGANFLSNSSPPASYSSATSITFACWAVWSGAHGTNMVLLGWTDATGETLLRFDANATPDFQFESFTAPSTSNMNTIASPTTGGFTSGKWFHFAGTFNHSTTLSQIYVNGASVANTSGGSLHAITSPTVYVGGSNGSNGWSGQIADAAIWNTVLTSTELLALAKGAHPYQIRTPSLLGYFPVDGIQSPEPDFSGNATNLSITGSLPLALGPPFTQFTPRWPRDILPSPPTTLFAQACL